MSGEVEELQNSVPGRKNGLERPFSNMQMSTWVLLPALMVHYGLFCAPVLPLLAALVTSAIFYGFCAAGAYSAYKAMSIDPMDNRLAAHLAKRATGQEERQTYEDHDHHDHDTKYCWVCETSVAKDSMHCKYCNKCIEKFDHHCQWLNTCVGKHNYSYFYATLWAITGLLFAHMCVMIAIVIDIFTDGNTRDEANMWLSTDAGLSLLVAIANIAFVILDGVAFGLVIQLLLFHMMLRRRGLTTYQFILEDNERKREANKVSTAREAKRVVNVQQAMRNGDTCTAYRLRIGGFCRKIKCVYCDPLQDDAPSSSPTAGVETREDAQQNGHDGDHDSDDDEYGSMAA